MLLLLIMKYQGSDLHKLSENFDNMQTIRL